MKRKRRSFSWVLLAFVMGCSFGEGGPSPAAEPVRTARRPPERQESATEPGKRPVPARREVAVLAGGCFWGMEELLRKQPGVIDTTVGYTGGTVADPEYGDVHTGTSGHAEAVRIEFDPDQTSFEKLLLYFFTIHDPTTKNRQGNDVGSQYRSAIFVQNDAQRRVAERVKERVEASGAWDGPITTRIEAASKFYRAEDYHQDYLQRIPNGYTCHYERDIDI